MTKVLITGANGYIGGRLIRTLLARGTEVQALVREPAAEMSVPSIVCDLAADGAQAVVASACDGVDAVVHLAGEDEVLSAKQPAKALAATVVATENVAEACASAAVSRLVYLSTVHVYGARIVPGAILTEDLRVEPRTAYAIARLASEHAAAALSRHGFDLVIFRLTNSVGAPHDPTVDRWTLVANDLCRQGSVDGVLRLRSSGTQWRDFVPLASVCSAIADATVPTDGLLPAGTYNLGSGRPSTVRALAEMIQDTFERETGHRPELRAPDPEPDPPGPYYVSIERAASEGLRPQAHLEEAVTDTVRFCLDHKKELR